MNSVGVRGIGYVPQRFVCSSYATDAGLLKNVGSVPVWYGDNSVEPGYGMPLYPGEAVVITEREVFVCAAQDITGPQSQQVSEDWGAKVAWGVQPQ